VHKIMGSGHRLLDDRAFWRHQEHGLAVYAAPNFFRSYWAPRPFRERAAIGDHFHITQLFPTLVDSTRFHLLALSQKHVRLIEATRTSAREMDLGDLPTSLAEAMRTEPPGQQLQQHVVTRVGGAMSGDRGATMFHGHGPGLPEYKKKAVRLFFSQLDGGIRSRLPERHEPLVLAGVEYLLSIYRDANSHPGLLPEGITGNFDVESPQQLGARGWDIVSRHVAALEDAALTRYEERTSRGKITADLATVVRASHEGRVDELFVADGAERWGMFEPESSVVTVREKPGAVGDELINLAVIHTFLRAGAIHVLPREKVPGGADAAATLRY
jgi:hypothetical protein